MLYIFYGDDLARLSRESRTAIEGEVKKKGAHLNELSGALSVGEYSDLAAGNALFGGTRVFLSEDALDTKEGREEVVTASDLLAASPHLFVFRAGKLDKETVTALKKTNAKLWEFSLPEKRGREGFNIFALADAFGERDKKRAWSLLATAFDEGLSAEEIHGTLFWGVKNMLSIKRAGARPEESGLAPFPLGKAVRFAKQFSERELEDMATKMVAMYHDAHRGLCDLDIELERLVLTVLDKEKKPA